MNRDELLTLMPSNIEINTGEDPSDALHNILLDDEWAREVGREERLPTVRVWRHAPVQGLVVSKRDVAGAKGEAAMQVMAGLGWPIFVRPTGGTAVPHGAGVLNFSLLLPRTQEKASTDAYYRLLCQPMLDWFAGLGLDATTGAVPGSYCDGNYNVLVDGLKLVGTAQAWRGGIAGTKSRHPGYVLAHACIVIDVDMAEATEVINRFYEEVGDDYRVDARTSTSLAEVLRQKHIEEAYDAQMAQTDFVRFLERYYANANLDVCVR
ncbi:lipoate--protein ligase family protein [Alicyclobacillus fastidiosus]|uniref:Ligase n=1 Tax=Alicyclobacillus fastidiosus TaxID=392011 RepID=A0ABV5A991_9BACL|nr:ligase [Alicyclobacillus fastidiosus]WEH10776.1 ligase [Alicyclobacillus fastidiosus]